MEMDKKLKTFGKLRRARKFGNPYQSGNPYHCDNPYLILQSGRFTFPDLPPEQVYVESHS